MSHEVDRIAAIALAEDGQCDITTELTVSPGLQAEGAIEFRSGGVLAGAAFADAVARACNLQIDWRTGDGQRVSAGTVIGVLQGQLASLLRAERPLLNLLQRACGIATATRAYVNAVAGTSCRILHTRKTAPGLRSLDIAAVLAGGGSRHRADLSHEVMVKDNHWRGLLWSGRELGEVLAEGRGRGISALQVEIESTDELEIACRAGATRLLIDNQTPETVRTWCDRARGLRSSIEIEATGGISLVNVRAYAAAGADYVSVGALTHSVQAANLAIEIQR